MRFRNFATKSLPVLIEIICMFPLYLNETVLLKTAFTLPGHGVSCSVCLVSERGKVREEVFGSEYVGGPDDHLPVFQRGCYFVCAANLGETYTCENVQ